MLRTHWLMLQGTYIWLPVYQTFRISSVCVDSCCLSVTNFYQSAFILFKFLHSNVKFCSRPFCWNECLINFASKCVLYHSSLGWCDCCAVFIHVSGCYSYVLQSCDRQYKHVAKCLYVCCSWTKGMWQCLEEYSGKISVFSRQAQTCLKKRISKSETCCPCYSWAPLLSSLLSWHLPP